MADGNLIVSTQIHPTMIPASLEEAYKMADKIARSGLFGCKTQDQAFALMALADAEGLHPAVAARDYHIIEGRPSLRADAMLARFQKAGGRVKWTERTDTKVSAIFSHEQGGDCEVTWTIEMAMNIKRWNRKKQKEERLTDGDNWKNYPRQMLTARTISEGVRTVYPGVAVGMYSPEEVRDFDDGGKVDLTQPETRPEAKAEPAPKAKKEAPKQSPRTADLIEGVLGCGSMNALETYVAASTSAIIESPEADRVKIQAAIREQRARLSADPGPEPQEAEFEERAPDEEQEREAHPDPDPVADKKFVTEICRRMLSRTTVNTLQQLWDKHAERLAEIRAYSEPLYSQAMMTYANAKDGLEAEALTQV